MCGVLPHRERDPLGQKLRSEQRPVQGAGLRAGERAGKRAAPQRRTRAGAAILRKRCPFRRRPVPRAAVFCGGEGTKRLQSTHELLALIRKAVGTIFSRHELGCVKDDRYRRDLSYFRILASTIQPICTFWYVAVLRWIGNMDSADYRSNLCEGASACGCVVSRQ